VTSVWKISRKNEKNSPAAPVLMAPNGTDKSLGGNLSILKVFPVLQEQIT